MDLKLDGNGDLATEAGDLVLISGIEAIAQDCQIRLKFFKGEWFQDTRLGMPWYQEILGKKPRMSVVSEILRKAIMGVPGILTITVFKPNYNEETRLFSLVFRADTVEGPLDFSEEFIV